MVLSTVVLRKRAKGVVTGKAKVRSQTFFLELLKWRSVLDRVMAWADPQTPQWLLLKELLKCSWLPLHFLHFSIHWGLNLTNRMLILFTSLRPEKTGDAFRL